MDDGGGNGARFRKIPVHFPIKNREHPQHPSPAERTTRQYAQRYGALFGRRALALDVMYAAACFCDLEQTGNVTEVSPELVCDGRVVIRQDVEALGFVGEAKMAALRRVRCFL